MKIVDTIILIDAADLPMPQETPEDTKPAKLANVELSDKIGKFSDTEVWKNLYLQITSAIKQCEWPEGSGSFTLNPTRHGSGVTLIKKPCMQYLKDHGWSLETRSRVATRVKTGPIDATLPVGHKLFCLEWETGNISSSHRALNKLAIGLIQGDFVGGVLIVPSNEMRKYITDRVGNFGELEPYFPLYQAAAVVEGILAVIVIEHDHIDQNVPLMNKQLDGNSLARRDLIEQGLYQGKGVKKKNQKPETQPDQQLAFEINESNL